MHTHTYTLILPTLIHNTSHHTHTHASHTPYTRMTHRHISHTSTHIHTHAHTTPHIHCELGSAEMETGKEEAVSLITPPLLGEILNYDIVT